MDQALRCSGIAAVVADGSGMTPITSRRLQLAAESGKALALIARPPWEAEEPSYAATRWEVRARGGGELQQWDINLIGCRGQQRRQDAPRNWNAEWSYQVFRGTGTFHLSPCLGRGTGAAGGAGWTQARSRTA
jgi:protein ImuA